jgi:hypothetical protein
LPLQDIPPFLVNIACHMARYHACTQAITENDPIKIRYDDACKKLKSISKGEMGLGGTPAGESVPTESSSNNVILVVGRRDFGGQYGIFQLLSKALKMSWLDRFSKESGHGYVKSRPMAVSLMMTLGLGDTFPAIWVTFRVLVHPRNQS